MIFLRRGVVTAVKDGGRGILLLSVDVAGEVRPAIAYSGLVAEIAEGDTVVLNASAIELGLGTGGYDVVIAVEGAAGSDPPPGAHAMKMRYTPLQAIVTPVEETHRDALDAWVGLGGLKVVACGLHSALPAVAIGARLAAPAARIAYVMTDAAALPIAFSETVDAVREAALLDVTITCGQAFGGDLEAVNVYSAIVAARAVAGADVVIVGMGPGNLGTGSRLGTTFLDQAVVVDAIEALGGEAVVVPRLSMADVRDRHRGLSHHTMTVLSLALGSWTLVVPALNDAEREVLEPQLQALKERAKAPTDRCRWITVDDDRIAEALATSPVPLRTMGRTFDDDPLPFRAAAAAGFYAATG